MLSMVALVALGLSRLVHGSLVSHATDKATAGLVATLIGASTVAGLFLPAGVASAAIKFIAIRRGRDDEAGAAAVYRLLSRINIVSTVALSVATAGAMWALFDLGAVDTLSVGLLTAAFALYSVDKAALYGFGRVSAYARLELLGSGLAIAGTVAVIAAGMYQYLVPLMLGYFVVVLGARVVLRPAVARERVAVPAADHRNIFGYIGLASLGAVASAGFLQGVPLLASQVTSREDVAYFGAAVVLVAPLSFVPRALDMALFPAMSQARGAGQIDKVAHNADMSVRALLVLLAPAVALAIPVTPEIMSVYGGTAYLPGAPVLQILLVAMYVLVVPVGAINLLSSGSSRDTMIPVGFAVAGGAVGVGMTLLLGARLGTIGVALGYLIGSTITASGPVTTVWRRFDLRWGGPFLRCLLVVGIAFGLARGLAELDLSAGARIWADIAAAIVAAGVGCLILRADIGSLLREIRRN
jgi:O-antigen/teichoic acid export membrane protein